MWNTRLTNIRLIVRNLTKTLNVACQTVRCHLHALLIENLLLHAFVILMALYGAKVEISRPSLRETRDKQPLHRYSDKS